MTILVSHQVVPSTFYNKIAPMTEPDVKRERKLFYTSACRLNKK